MDRLNIIAAICRWAWRFRLPVQWLLFGGWSTAVIWSYWETFSAKMAQTPWVIWIVVWLLIPLTLIYAIFGLVIIFFSGKPDTFEGYRNREYLRWGRGSLERELRGAKKSIWIYWDNGSVAQNSSLFSDTSITSKITKLIVMDKAHPSIQATKNFDQSINETLLAGLIERTVAQARGANIDVRTLTIPVHLPPMVIVDADSWLRGYVRFDGTWPGFQADDRPSIIIKRRQYGALFQRICDSYDAVFGTLQTLKR